MNPESSIAVAESPWLVRRKPQASPRLRLFCFPYAGAGSLPYFRWPDLLPEADLEVCAVQPPGRESRLHEPSVEELPQLLDALVRELSPLFDSPFAFFGHSLGALIAFELTRELRRRGLPLPGTLLVSGSEAPSQRSGLPPLSGLRRDDFIRELSARYDGIPRQVLAQPEILDLILPILRADLKISERYTYQEEPPLPVRLCAFGGTRDPRVSEAALDAWRLQTQQAFSMKMFPGGHFFLNELTAQVVQAVHAELAVGATPAP
ncbi:thioesterase II family protein [Myxococcus vastator]|uniref:thioesterase II family protein n=1 Tax=Myxococcus vastator TaxID=2709664 RepID=UPI0013D627B6|nr:alpha/beta fold hydrolase [Myxococcus vastator]